MFGKNKNSGNIEIDGNIIGCSINNVSIQNGVVKVNGKVIESNIGNCVNVIIHGDVGTIDCSGSVEVHGNSGSIDCGGSCTVKGDINGDLDCGGSCVCGKVSGDIDAGGSVVCKR